MGYLESDWDFTAPSLALAATSDNFALRICAVDLTNAPKTAEALDKSKRFLAASQIAVEVADIKVKPLRKGAKSALQGIFAVATLLPKASEMLKLVCNGPPGAHRHLFDLAEIGRIPSKGAYPPRSKVAKLPFNGAKYIPLALVRAALCVTETHGAERAVYMQNQVLIPALVARLDAEVADKQRTLAEHEAKATDATADATVRQRANDAIVAQSPYLSALGVVWPQLGECFSVLLVEPLAKHTHSALDSALDYAVHDYEDKNSMKLRGQVCNGSRTESSLLYIVKRITGISGAVARVISLLSSTLLSMPLPEMFLKLPPIFVLSKPKLVAATSEADSIAAQFSTTRNL